MASALRAEGYSCLISLLHASTEESLVPDYASISEPITTTLDLSEDEVREAWEAWGGTWRDSLDIVNSIVCTVPIQGAPLSCSDYDDSSLRRLNFCRIRITVPR